MPIFDNPVKKTGKTYIMKTKSISLLLFIIISQVALSQKSSSFFRAGVNLANVSITESGNIDDANMLISLQAGIYGDIPVSDFLSIQPGLLLNGKGSKTESGNPSNANYYRATSNPWYVEIPVNVVLKAPMNKESKFFAGAGPYVAMGIAGKRKAEGKVLGVSFNREDDIEFSNDDPTTSGEEGAGFGILKRFDYGFNGIVGIEGKSAMFSINYGLGLAKLQSGTTNNTDNNNKHRVLSFVIGFRL